MADGVFREDVVDVGDYEIGDLFSDSCSDESESSGMHIYARPSTTTTTTIGLGFRVLPFSWQLCGFMQWVAHYW
ncbi:hypothetical protein Syun_024055 [Stephania yunnanensis]|uniref:Uncharacterized protein n=1 Tax=Stephania yunnanensis TaxID=152371 RepID=A0AAP0I3Y0_9MAGN